MHASACVYVCVFLSVCVCVCMCMCIHACMCVCVCVCVCARVHMYVCTCMQACVCACVCAYMHACKCVCVCVCVRACMCMCIHASICVCVHVRTCMHVCVCVYVRVRACVHVCMCTCMYHCVHTCLCVYLGSRAVVGTAGGQVVGPGCRQVEPHGVAWEGLAGQGRGGCWVLGGQSGRQAMDPSSLSSVNTHSVIHTITQCIHRPFFFVNSKMYRTQLPWGHRNVQKNITDEETVHMVTS